MAISVSFFSNQRPVWLAVSVTGERPSHSGAPVFCLNRLYRRKPSRISPDTGSIHIHILCCSVTSVLWNGETCWHSSPQDYCQSFCCPLRLSCTLFTANNNTPRLTTWLSWMEMGFIWRGDEMSDSLVSSQANVAGLDHFCWAYMWTCICCWQLVMVIRVCVHIYVNAWWCVCVFVQVDSKAKHIICNALCFSLLPTPYPPPLCAGHVCSAVDTGLS